MNKHWRILFKLLIICTLLLPLSFAQTKIGPSQISISISFPPPVSETYFSTDQQTILILAPGTNTQLTKVVIYRNGLRQTNIGKVGPPIKLPDYSISSDLKTITFTNSLPAEDTILVDYWIR